MFGIGWTEFVVIALVLLIFVGPRQLPAMLRKIGQVIGELRSASHDLRTQVQDEVRDIEETIGSIPSPKSVIRDAASDLAYDMKSPYEEVRKTEKEVLETLSELKTEVQSVDRKADGADAKPSDDRSDEKT